MVLLFLTFSVVNLCLTLDRELDLEELELERLLDLTDERLLEALLERTLEELDRLLEALLLSLFDALLLRVATSTILLRWREEELEEDLDDAEELERSLELELLERELRERELLELEEVLFFRPGTRIFLSFIRTFLSSRISSSSLRLITLMIFSAAFSPT